MLRIVRRFENSHFPYITELLLFHMSLLLLSFQPKLSSNNLCQMVINTRLIIFDLTSQSFFLTSRSFKERNLFFCPFLSPNPVTIILEQHQSVPIVYYSLALVNSHLRRERASTIEADVAQFGPPLNKQNKHDLRPSRPP